MENVKLINILKIENMSKLSEKFSKLIDKIDDAVVDLSTLDVITISGNIKSIIPDGKFMKPADFIKNYDAQNSDIQVKGFTHIDFDQDVIQFYPENIKEDDLSYKLHQQAVESSKAARQAVFSFIKEIV